jgi:hypothetical protein
MSDLNLIVKKLSFKQTVYITDHLVAKFLLKTIKLALENSILEFNVIIKNCWNMVNNDNIHYQSIFDKVICLI